MKGRLKKIRGMAMGNINIMIIQNTMDNGEMMKKMVQVRCD